METQLITKKLECIESELNNLKTIVLVGPKKNIVKIEGILNGLKVTDKDITMAKKSLFPSS